MLVWLVSATAFFGDHFFVLQIGAIDNINSTNKVKLFQTKSVWKQLQQMWPKHHVLNNKTFAVLLAEFDV